MLERALVELESVEALEAHLAAGGDLEGTALQGLDLVSPALVGRLMHQSWDGAFVLGCRLDPALQGRVLATGGIVFPRLDLPFEIYRRRLYNAEELMSGYVRGRRESLSQTRDGLIYSYSQRYRDRSRPVPIMVSLALRIHDHAIDDALIELLYPGGGEPRKVVGVMGGHGMSRSDSMFRTIAEMARTLGGAGYLVATGGGPGAMEAANLGAYLADHDEQALDQVLEVVRRQPDFQDDGYLDVAYEALELVGQGCDSLAVPTWYYGHEPTNLFSSHVAKYFDNSLREEGLLAIARHGVVYAPGSAGTLQEVFMDTTQNHYGTLGEISPMVFLDRAFWTEQRPVVKLLEGLAGDRPYRSMIGVCSSASEAADFIMEHPPRAAQG